MPNAVMHAVRHDVRLFVRMHVLHWTVWVDHQPGECAQPFGMIHLWLAV